MIPTCWRWPAPIWRPMSKGGNKTVTQQLDPRSAQYVDQMRRYALGAAGVPGTPGAQGPPSFSDIYKHPGGQPYQPMTPNLPPEIAQAQQQYQNYAQGGNLGLSALTGNA